MLWSTWSASIYVLGILVVLVVGVVLCYPDTLHHPDNFCYVDRYVTPKHIVPEWYFLPFYSMLRACSIKVVGVILLGTAVLVYVVLLLVLAEVHSSRGLHQGLALCPRPLHHVSGHVQRHRTGLHGVCSKESSSS